MKTDIRSGVCKNEMVRFEFTRYEIKQKLTWLSKREFKYAEMVYRVVQVKYSGDKLIYLCFKNSESAVLLEDIDAMVDSAMGLNAEAQKALDNLASFANNLFCPEKEDLINPVSFAEIRHENHTTQRIIIRYSEAIVPPPKFCIC